VPRAVVLVAWVAEAGDEPGRVLHWPRRGVGDGGDDGDQARTADAAEWCRDAPAVRVGGGEEGCGEVSGGGGSGRGEQRHGGRASERRRREGLRRRRRRWRRRTEAIGAGQRRRGREIFGLWPLSFFRLLVWTLEENGKYLDGIRMGRK
jgi:hypothetical protein